MDDLTRYDNWMRYGVEDADREVVMIAAWLHDIASISNYALYEEHHIHGAEITYEILSKFSYKEDKIALVQACIRNHRGSVYLEKSSIEELCVADADAISHFDSVPSLLYLAYLDCPNLPLFLQRNSLPGFPAGNLIDKDS